ncbi:MAG TPA: thermonuclease family protein [Methylotenera sp.]
MIIKLHLTTIFITAFFVILSLSYADAATITGRVIAVTDGDTIRVLDNTNTQYKIRLAGIDAPEKKQAFGNVSKKSLSDLVYGKQVFVDWQKQDRYGRKVGKVVINGQDANLEQIKRGMAWFYSKYQNELVMDDRLNYLHAHEFAQAGRVGLWLDKEPMAPWDFRKTKKAD